LGVNNRNKFYLRKKIAYREVVRDILGIELVCVRSVSYKLIYDGKSDTYELYDLRIDPDDKNNLWPVYGNEEIDELVLKLRSYSEMKVSQRRVSSQQDKKAIEKTLRSL